MEDPIHELISNAAPPDHSPGEMTPPEKRRRRKITSIWAIITLVAFLTGSFGGYFVGSWKHRDMEMTNSGQSDMAALVKQIHPPEGYALKTTFGDIGPKMLEAGAMHADTFIQVYEQAGQPLTDQQIAILKEGSPEQVVFNQENAYFLLNFFWAFGLTNANPILTEGPMMSKGPDSVVNFASTGGWSLAAKPVKDLYASAPIVTLTPEQQERLEEVAQEVYRPCCDNPTHFPDCNHGMAMLGLLELMASQGASVDEMFAAAKYANAYWYPQQTLELATYFKYMEKVDFDQADSRQLVGRRYSSISGFQAVHQWLSANGLLQQSPGAGNSCGV